MLSSYSKSDAERRLTSKFRWGFDKTVSFLVSRLANFLRNTYQRVYDSSSFNIDRFSFVSEKSKSCGFVFPVSRDEHWCVAYHITERLWFCSKEKAKEHITATIRRIASMNVWERRKIKTITIFLLGNYTSKVFGREMTAFAKKLCRRYGLTDNVKVYVFSDKNAMDKATQRIINFLKTRMVKLLGTFKDKGYSPYGVVKDIIDGIKYLLEGFNILLNDKIPVFSAKRIINRM